MKMEKLKLIKQNKESDIYENNEYHVKVCNLPGYVFKKNGYNNVPYDDDKKEKEWIKARDAVRLEITNKKTGKTARVTCYQGYYEAIQDLQYDLQHGKIKFKKEYDKIDA